MSPPQPTTVTTRFHRLPRDGVAATATLAARLTLRSLGGTAKPPTFTDFVFSWWRWKKSSPRWPRSLFVALLAALPFGRRWWRTLSRGHCVVFVFFTASGDAKKTWPRQVALLVDAPATVFLCGRPEPLVGFVLFFGRRARAVLCAIKLGEKRQKRVRRGDGDDGRRRPASTTLQRSVAVSVSRKRRSS